MLAFSEGRSEATLRLEAVMKSQAVATRRRMLGAWIAAAAVVGLSAGAAGAWLNRPEYLLNVASEGVERKESAKLQYWHAMKLNTEEAWLQCGAVFPADGPGQSRVCLAGQAATGRVVPRQ